jgi:hypothetical protein
MDTSVIVALLREGWLSRRDYVATGHHASTLS